MSKYSCVIFDFDGTIADTGQGVKESVKFALNSLGYSNIEITDDVVGPSPYFLYNKIFGFDDCAAKKAVFFHRKYSKEKAYLSAKIYPGVFDSLFELKNIGCELYIVSLKSEGVINEILSCNNLCSAFKKVVGITENETISKAQLLKNLIDNEKLKKVLYVGDTESDLLVCKSLNIDFCYASYGFGSVSQNDVISIKHFSDIVPIVS